MMSKSPRVLVLGVDGASWTIIREGLSRNELPGFARLMKEGLYATSLSTVHSQSPQAWSSCICGVNPGKHGIFGFLRRSESGYHLRPITAADRCSKAFWNLLSARNGRAGIVNVPITYPVEPMAGFLIPGFGGPVNAEHHATPRGIWRTIPRQVRRPQRVQRGQPLHTYWRTVLARDEVSWRAACWLWRLHRPEIGMVVLVACDRIQHVYWGFMENPSDQPEFSDIIPQCYRRIDRWIEQTIQDFPESDLLVVSDHGAGPLRGTVHLDSWLSRHGYQSRKNSNRDSEIQLGRWARLRMPVSRALHRTLPTSITSRIRSRVRGISNIDWQRTYAYSVETAGNLFLNLRGREPHGIITPGREYERMREELISKLVKLRHEETGEPLVEHAHRREELYWGPALELAPDIVIRWADDMYNTDSRIVPPEHSLVSAPRPWDWDQLPFSGYHRREGILLARGPNIPVLGEIDPVSVMDVAPTVLALLRIPVPQSMDGRPLPGLQCSPARTGDRDLSIYRKTRTDVLTPGQQRSVLRRLRYIGYI